MCEFCVKHGEGKKWYLRAENYSSDLLSDVKRYEFTKDFFYWLDRTYKTKFNFLKILPTRVPIIGNIFSGMIKHWLLYKHWGQVVPFEDVVKIIEMTNSITRVPCICRASSTGKVNRICILLSVDPGKIGMADIVDQSFFGGPDVAKFETLSKEDAINFLKQQELSGMIHTVWTFKAPFIAGICSCDLTGCIPMKMYKEVSPVIFRSEYIASVAADECIGCRLCMKKCQFNALKFDMKNKKVMVDGKRCYGCGICRFECKKDAISLSARHVLVKRMAYDK